MKRLKRWLIVAPVLALVLTAGCAKKKSNPADADALDFYNAFVSEFYRVPHPNDNAFDLRAGFEVPAVTSSGMGSAFFTWQPTSLQYEIELNSMNGVIAADIALGAETQNGATLAHLFTGPTTGTVNGTLATGTIDASKLIGTTWDEFKAKCQSGDAYVNILTTSHPTGELRGQTAFRGILAGTWNPKTEEYSYTFTLPRGFNQMGTLDLAYFASTSTPNTSAIIHVNLVSTPKQADANGLFATGMFDYTDIHGATQQQFLDALNSGHIEVLFKTSSYPNGLLRGQLLQQF